MKVSSEIYILPCGGISKLLSGRTCCNRPRNCKHYILEDLPGFGRNIGHKFSRMYFCSEHKRRVCTEESPHQVSWFFEILQKVGLFYFYYSVPTNQAFFPRYRLVKNLKISYLRVFAFFGSVFGFFCSVFEKICSVFQKFLSFQQISSETSDVYRINCPRSNFCIKKWSETWLLHWKMAKFS